VTYRRALFPSSVYLNVTCYIFIIIGMLSGVLRSCTTDLVGVLDTGI
jgi:hypothetical protein